VIRNIQTNLNGKISNRARQQTAHVDDVLTFGKLMTVTAICTGLVGGGNENKQI
jgi:hypothetical protein